MAYVNSMGALALAGMAILALPARGLDPADEQAFPFPPGEHAALVRQVCASCHEAGIVLGQRYDEENAAYYYSMMVGGDPESEEGQKIIQYLTTVLGR